MNMLNNNLESLIISEHPDITDADGYLKLCNLLYHHQPSIIEFQEQNKTSHPFPSISPLVSHRPEVHRQPLSSYLYIIQQCPTPIVTQWASNVIYAIEQLNQLATAHNSHKNTQIILLTRMRLASEARLKQHRNKTLTKLQQQYLWLWQILPIDKIGLDDFVALLISFEKDKHLTKFQHHLMRDLRRAYQYILMLKPKKLGHSSHSAHHIESVCIDENESVFALHQLNTKLGSRTLQYEYLHDEQEAQNFEIDTDKNSALAQHSVLIQRETSRVIHQHIVRLQHHFNSSSHYPDLKSITALATHSLEQYQANPKNKAYLVILLSLLTGNRIEDWLKLQNPRVRRLNQRQTLIEKDDFYFLRSKFSLFEDRYFEHSEALLNQITYFDLPLPNSLIKGLKTGKLISSDDIKKTLKYCREKLYIPSLTSKKLSTLLHATVYQTTGNAQLADILSGLDTNLSSSLSYCSYPTYKLQESYLNTVQHFSNTLTEKLRIALKVNPYHLNFGSRKAPNQATVKAIFAYLYAQIVQAEYQADWIAKFNHYNIWLWHVLLLLTGARPVRDFPNLLNAFDLENGWLWISDKEVHSRNGDGRLIPLCPFLIKQITLFITYINQCKHQLEVRQAGFKTHLDDILLMKKPLLSVFIEGKFQSLSPSIVYLFSKDLKLEHANWTRHTTRAFLTGRADENLILALFGHEKIQHEFGHSFSSLSLHRYKTLANELEAMREYFEIDGVQHG